MISTKKYKYIFYQKQYLQYQLVTSELLLHNFVFSSI